MDEANPSDATDAFVAPLKIEKTKRTSSIASRKSGSRSSRSHSRTHSLSSHSCSSSHRQMTPPPTPRSSQDSLVEHSAPSAFHPFLRAFYPFHPTYTADSSTVTLPLNTGDIIMVHSVHTNGWADGTLLTSGARGWLPTNYCETYETTHIRLLLKGCLGLFQQFRGGLTGGARASQIAVTGIVAGVRNLLESTDCLTREALNVKSSDEIRKSRKMLLTELSGLVKSAKRLPGYFEHASIGSTDDITDELILRTFKIVLRGVRFLDAWYDQYEITSSYIDSYNGDEDTLMNDSVPPTPPCDALTHCGGSSLQRSVSINDGYFGSQSSSRHSRGFPSDGNPSTTDKPQSHPFPSTPYSHTPRSVSPESHRQSFSRRSSAASAVSTMESVYALARLNTTHDVLLSYLGSYIGRIHLQARFTSQLQLTQDQSVAAARDLLAVVEGVYARDPRAKALEIAKDAMYQRISALISAAKEVVSNRMDDDSDDEEEGGVLIPDGGRCLVEAATGCVRGAGECVAKSKFVIERIGDFELQSAALNIGLGIMTKSMEISNSDVMVSLGISQGESDRETMPPPPTPDKIPPPLPPKEYSSWITKPHPELPPAVPLKVDTAVQPPSAAIVVVPLPMNIEPTPVMDSISRRSSTASLLPVPHISTLALQGEYSVVDAMRKKETERSLFNTIRTESIGGESISATDSTSVNSIRRSDFSMVSQSSTRATTPEPQSATSIATPALLNTSLLGDSQLSLSGTESIVSESHMEDLTYNKDRQITGGTLPALIEKLTVHDATPDAVFVATFYLTFRLFTTPRDFAQALVDRFDSVGAVPGAMPVRLRVYNVFKGWLESHWRKTSDNDALEIIINFADSRLKALLPAAANRLQELADKVSDLDVPLVPRLVSGMASSTTYSPPEMPIPSPTMTRSQLGALKTALTPGGAPVSILDFDPLELARQFTLKESKMFCSIRPEELIAQEWTKKSGSIAVNVLAMSSLSTDLAHLVAETILDVHDIKKRAVVIKHWIKIADRCLELNNYDSLMAIMCTMNTSTIVRLKRTWELVSHKTKNVLEHLRSVIDVSKNHAVLRARLRGHVPPCLPFLGTYLTDLTFVDVGNPSKRPVSIDGSTKQLINFDKHVKTARIISELQRFQIPYRIAEIPEMQSWIDVQIERIHNSKAADVQHLYRRSLLLEPRENQIQKVLAEVQTLPVLPVPSIQREPSSTKTDLFAWAHVFKTPAS